MKSGSQHNTSIYALVEELNEHPGYQFFMKLYNFCSPPDRIESDMDKFTKDLVTRIGQIENKKDAISVAALAHCVNR